MIHSSFVSKNANIEKFWTLIIIKTQPNLFLAQYKSEYISFKVG